jgi:serine-type D-Ala-D-Ala carboxypeptidase/endopeptidase (penicillin-binding protein 4)
MIFGRHFWLVCLCLILPLAAQPVAQPKQTIQQILAAEKYAESSVGVVVKCLENDSTVATLNADSQYIPASVLKLVTAAAAFEILGMNYTFRTRIYSPLGLQRDSGAVPGDLYVKGGGDPGFLAERVWLLVQHLKFRGVRSIAGNIFIDESFFDTTSEAPGYEDDKSSRAYEAPIGALSASFNTVSVYYRPGDTVGAPLLIDCFPQIDGIKVISSAKTGPAGKRSSVRLWTEKKDGTTCILLTGTMPFDAPPDYSYQKVWETGDNFGGAIKSLLAPSGISFHGQVITRVTPDSVLSMDPILVFESQPLAEFVRYMYKYSSNFTADMVFKTLSAESRSGRGGTWGEAAGIVANWWKNNGLPGTPRIVNGSGMGHDNRLSPAQIVALLRHVWGQKSYFPDYCADLSVAGIDGTVKSRFAYSRLKGIVRAKTGTLNNYGASTLAGYALYPGKTYAFAILINNSVRSQYQHWTLQEKILEAVLP